MHGTLRKNPTDRYRLRKQITEVANVAAYCIVHRPENVKLAPILHRRGCLCLRDQWNER